MAILHAVVPEMIASIQAVADRSNLHTPFDLVLSGALNAVADTLLQTVGSQSILILCMAFPGFHILQSVLLAARVHWDLSSISP